MLKNSATYCLLFEIKQKIPFLASYCHKPTIFTEKTFKICLNRGCASKSKNPGKMVVMDFVTNMFKHLNLDVKKGPTPYLGLTQPLGAVLRT